MPMYDYSCGVCNTTVSIFRNITDSQEAYSCESCNSILKRVYSPVGVTFNGNGFYRTDNRKV